MYSLLPSMGLHRVRHDWSDLAAFITIITFFFFFCLIFLKNVSRTVVSDSLRPYGLYVVFQVPLSMEFSRQEYWSG